MDKNNNVYMYLYMLCHYHAEYIQHLLQHIPEDSSYYDFVLGQADYFYNALVVLHDDKQDRVNINIIIEKLSAMPFAQDQHYMLGYRLAHQYVLDVVSNR